MYRPTLLGALTIADPAQAREIITSALEASGGNVTHAAAALRVSHRQLCRLIPKLKLQAALAAARDTNVIAKAR